MTGAGISPKFVLEALWVKNRARELQDEHDGKATARAAGGER